MKFITCNFKFLPCLLLLLLFSAPKALGEFSYIPAGDFMMGNEGSNNDYRAVFIDAFCMGNCEVTKGEWDKVRTWALSNGYALSNGNTNLELGAGKAGAHPIQKVSWYDVVKWCNARSEKEGLKPFYYTDGAQTKVYRTGKIDVTNAQVKWTANGYRLPTEAEWEKAARGKLEKALYPWGDTISHKYANYYDNGHHAIYKTGSEPYTSPCKSFKPNRYGLYDVAGNVNEWCWDRYGDYAKDDLINPRGPSSGSDRIYRGGSWKESELICQVGYRLKTVPSYSIADSIGFRLATTPRITSSMARIVVARGKQIQRYTIQTNFGAKKFIASGLPPGLSLRSTGIIVGAPTKLGTYRATITAEKMQGAQIVGKATATKVFVIK